MRSRGVGSGHEGPAPVNADSVAGDEGCQAAGEELDESRHILHCAQPADGVSLDLLLHHVVVQVASDASLLEYLGLDQPRVDGVDPDTFAGKVQR